MSTVMPSLRSTGRPPAMSMARQNAVDEDYANGARRLPGDPVWRNMKWQADIQTCSSGLATFAAAKCQPPSAGYEGAERAVLTVPLEVFEQPPK